MNLQMPLELKGKYDQSAIQLLSKRTQYEAWLLEAIYTTADQSGCNKHSDSFIYPANGSHPISCANANLSMHDWRESFLNAGAPLVFVSTFKVLDMFFEWVIERNDSKVKHQFQEKILRLKPHLINETNKPCPKPPLVFPSFLETQSGIKNRLIELYAELEPLRGTIIHNRLFSSSDGSLSVRSTKPKQPPGPIVSIAGAQLNQLARIALTVLRCVEGTWLSTMPAEKLLRYYLDEVQHLHKLEPFGQKQPVLLSIRIYTKESDPLLVDVDKIRRDRLAQPTCEFMFDLRVLLVREEKVTDAFLFPWSIFDNNSPDCLRGIDPEIYRVEKPTDINPSHCSN